MKQQKTSPEQKGAGTDAGMDTTATMAPSTEAVNVDTEARRVGTITAKQRRKIDRWLIKAFKLNDFDHLRLLARLPNSTKLYRLLDDARLRGNWQASALWLEMHHPEHWAPSLKNMTFIDSGQSGKSFRKDRKAGRQNGTSNKTD